jgi:hypothetical protein
MQMILAEQERPELLSDGKRVIVWTSARAQLRHTLRHAGLCIRRAAVTITLPRVPKALVCCCSHGARRGGNAPAGAVAGMHARMRILRAWGLPC